MADPEKSALTILSHSYNIYLLNDGSGFQGAGKQFFTGKFCQSCLKSTKNVELYSQNTGILKKMRQIKIFF